MVVKRKLGEEKMHGRQASDERLYLPEEGFLVVKVEEE